MSGARRLLQELACSDRRVRELAALAGLPQNLLGYHLGQLRAGGLVTSRRSSFDGRHSCHRLDLARCALSLAAAGTTLHRGLRARAQPASIPSNTASRAVQRHDPLRQLKPRGARQFRRTHANPPLHPPQH
jgi:DNA-binding transcriptional ArsR family regulator